MKRLVVKLGTSTLTGGSARLSRRALLNIVTQTVTLLEAGHQVALVSSGAVCRIGLARSYSGIRPRMAGSTPVSDTRAAVNWRAAPMISTR